MPAGKAGAGHVGYQHAKASAKIFDLAAFGKAKRKIISPCPGGSN